MDYNISQLSIVKLSKLNYQVEKYCNPLAESEYTSLIPSSKNIVYKACFFVVTVHICLMSYVFSAHVLKVPFSPSEIKVPGGSMS